MDTTTQDGNRPPFDAPRGGRGDGDKNDDTRLPDCNERARRRAGVAAKRTRRALNGAASRTGLDAECRVRPKNARRRAIVSIRAAQPKGGRGGARASAHPPMRPMRTRAQIPRADREPGLSGLSGLSGSSGASGASGVANFDPIFFFYHRLRSHGSPQQASPTQARRTKRDRAAA
ncbi:hypothetical protein M218_19600 [Burkholderia pseudomallei MSHR338]|uniref:hypothetical protein n=1 Tax=Burkholderia pseudomallei TaxID=28450 RepID=UPI0001A4236B|nr:hypothetical protein [Burkholderia pseudomallei]AIP07736.1 hypothetical protein DP55_4485 [Burkholderia pseudomallei]EEP49195.1 conserved hypothetical protein [Burkholderia pseudomallei MSHR346]EQA87335.1 hypothetical protein M218_19600 [Burkholderia pseudomallei MSHR338]OMW34428.1 hypothetical protein AQ807_04930 [Burkholderia pseudomallei]ONA22379.1 hypothetical protein AQ879_20000 [Burkholderia pseudomallei]